jgi:type I restriction enzyme, S subunit
MSRIDDLIAEHCPEGVEFKTLGEVGEFVRGNGLQKKDFVEAGFPCIHYGQIYTFYGTSTTTTKSFVAPELAIRLKQAQTGDLVVTTTSENIEDVCTAVVWLGEAPIAIGGHSCVFKHTLDPMYAAFYFQTEQFEIQKRKFVTGTKVKDIKVSDLGRIKIPVPPPAVQREIAGVLSKMEMLKAGLESELEYRSRQFAHYRDSLLGYASGAVQWTPMGEVGQFIRGRRFTKNDIVTEGIGCINFGEIYTHYGTFANEVVSRVREEMAPSLRFAKTGDVVLAAVSETVEDICKAVAWLGDEDVAVHDDCFLYRHTLNPKFVSYFLQTSSFRAEKAKYVARAKVKRISGESLAKLKIPVPSHAEQERIVEILDKFDALVKDLSFGLPAEIAARRQQYEYYRDRLLTFQETAA